MTTARLLTVEVTADERGLHVTPVFTGVDRPRTGGWGLRNTPAHRKLAARLVRCIEAVTAEGCAVKTDVRGETYADFSLPVIGRSMNADLRGLGF